MVDMGMTDSQFKAFVRFLIDALKEVKEEEGEKREKKLDKPERNNYHEHRTGIHRRIKKSISRQ